MKVSVDFEIRIKKLEIKGAQCIHCGRYFVGKYHHFWSRSHVRVVHGKRPVFGAKGNVRSVSLLVEDNGISLPDGVLEISNALPH